MSEAPHSTSAGVQISLESRSSAASAGAPSPNCILHDYEGTHHRVAASGNSQDTEFLQQSVEELQAKIRLMKRMMEECSEGLEKESKKGGRKKGPSPTSPVSGGPGSTGIYLGAGAQSLIDGSFLSVVFGVVLCLILGVSFYAFQNLYYAILKKFPPTPGEHTDM